MDNFDKVDRKTINRNDVDDVKKMTLDEAFSHCLSTDSNFFSYNTEELLKDDKYNIYFSKWWYPSVDAPGYVSYAKKQSGGAPRRKLKSRRRNSTKKNKRKKRHTNKHANKRKKRSRRR